MKAHRAKQFRVHLWLNTKGMIEMFCIQTEVDGKWVLCRENGKPLIFSTKEAATAKVMELSNGNPEGLLKLPKVV